MNEFRTYHFQNCEVRYFPAAEYLETVFPDGLKCPAQFRFELDDAIKARDLGYSDLADKKGIRQMHLEHELAHTFIAEALGEPWCPVLRSVAVKGPCEGAWEREELVMAFQRVLNGLTTTTTILDQINEKECVRDFCRRFRP